MKWLKSWPLLLVAVLLLLGTAGYAVVEGFDQYAASLLASGLVVLGAWIVEEVTRD